jgi:hypothetical protein
MVAMENETRAFYDWARWVADCAHCPSALIITPKQDLMRCPTPPEGTGCGGVSHIVWPDDPETIARDLAGLPEHRRSWNWPAGE